MKRFIILLVILSMSLSCSVAVLADATQETVSMTGINDLSVSYAVLYKERNISPVIGKRLT